MAKPSAHLTSRDRTVLEHVFRHRLGTDEILRRCFFPDVRGNRPVRKVMTRLVERKFLREYSLAPNEFYYILAPRGARAIVAGLSRPVTVKGSFAAFLPFNGGFTSHRKP